ncbi:MAG: thermonuclease family protein [Candidatus Paceibacterota bacterium]
MDRLIEYLTLFLISVATFFNFGVIEPPPSISDEAVYAEVLHVIDGDTIDVLLNGSRERIRYIGIDTPEIEYDSFESECFAVEARDMNRDLVEGKQVRLIADTEDRDQYDRLLRYVYVDDLFINRYLLRKGAATTLSIPPNTKYCKEFNQIEFSAKEEGNGRWGMCL